VRRSRGKRRPSWLQGPGSPPASASQGGKRPFAHYFGAGSSRPVFRRRARPVADSECGGWGSLQAPCVPCWPTKTAPGRGATRQSYGLRPHAADIPLGLALVSLVIGVFAEPIIRVTAEASRARASPRPRPSSVWCAALVVLNGFLAVVLGALNTFGEYRPRPPACPTFSTGWQNRRLILLAPALHQSGGCRPPGRYGVAQCRSSESSH
jgi:hypothetical protein